MKFKDIFWLSFKDLSEKKVRTALTVLMVVIGVASIVALVSQTAGISVSITKELSSLGPSSILLTSTSGGFTQSDVYDISTLPNVSSATPLLTGSATLVANNQNVSVTVIGATPAGLTALLGGNLTIYNGTMYTDSISPSAVLGYDVAFNTTSGKQNVLVGSPTTLKISSGRGGSSSYTVPVVGVLKSYGTGLISVDSGVAMSLPAAELMLHRTSFNIILVKANSTNNVTALTTLLTSIYGTNARVLSTQQLAETASSIIGSLTLFLVVIAGIALLVAAVGIMNIMLISVLERTHEIGIMKSLGFKNTQVMSIFLFQAMLIGILGGIIGVAAGAGASYGVAYLISHIGSGTSASTATASSSTAASRSSSSSRSFSGGSGEAGGAPPSGGFSGGSGSGAPSGSSTSSSSSLSYSPVLTLSTIIEAMLVAIIVSALAGIYPAWRASKMEPIEALRQL
jgi:ABC-type antimicrobial peptide transport system permease subunit